MDPSAGAAFAPPEPASSEPAGEGQLALVPAAPPDPPPVAAARPAPPMLHHEPSANSAFAVEVLQGLASSEPPLATATMAPLQEMPPAPAMAQQPPAVGMPDGGAAMYGYYGASEGNPAVYGGAYHPAMYAPLGQQSAAGYPVSAMPPQYWSSMGYYLQPNQLQPNQQPVPMPQSQEPQQPPRQPRQQKAAPEATAAVPAAAGSTADARELASQPATRPAKKAKTSTVTPWRPSEDSTILQGVAESGCKWSLIAQLLPGRSDNAVRNRWHRLEKAERQRREALEAGRPVEGYRCRKCGHFKKGHMCLGLEGGQQAQQAVQQAQAAAQAQAGQQQQMMQQQQMLMMQQMQGGGMAAGGTAYTYPSGMEELQRMGHVSGMEELQRAVAASAADPAGGGWLGGGYALHGLSRQTADVLGEGGAAAGVAGLSSGFSPTVAAAKAAQLDALRESLAAGQPVGQLAALGNPVMGGAPMAAYPSAAYPSMGGRLQGDTQPVCAAAADGSITALGGADGGGAGGAHYGAPPQPSPVTEPVPQLVPAGEAAGQR